LKFSNIKRRREGEMLRDHLLKKESDAEEEQTNIKEQTKMRAIK
jgi:hypothetical protein